MVTFTHLTSLKHLFQLLKEFINTNFFSNFLITCPDVWSTHCDHGTDGKVRATCNWEEVEVLTNSPCMHSLTSYVTKGTKVCWLRGWTNTHQELMNGIIHSSKLIGWITVIYVCWDTVWHISMTNAVSKHKNIMHWSITVVSYPQKLNSNVHLRFLLLVSSSFLLLLSAFSLISASNLARSESNLRMCLSTWNSLN